MWKSNDSEEMQMLTVNAYYIQWMPHLIKSPHDNRWYLLLGLCMYGTYDETSNILGNIN